MYGKYSANIGRQVLQYDDNRLFTKANWSSTPNAHDALKLKYKFSDFEANIVYGWKNASNVLYNTGTNYN